MTVETLNFLLGALTALMIPFINLLYQSFKKWNELRKIKNMIFIEYINPIDNLTTTLDIKTQDEYKMQVSTALKRLDYLLNNEIKYMSSENQFSIIRMIEYTKMYLKRVLDILKEHQFEDIGATSRDTMKEKQPKIKDITQKYKSTINEYMKLRRDFLDSPIGKE